MGTSPAMTSMQWDSKEPPKRSPAFGRDWNWTPLPWKRLELDPAVLSSKEKFHNSSRLFAVAFSSQ